MALALVVGSFIAYRTARSITEPLSKLMAVAHKIGKRATWTTTSRPIPNGRMKSENWPALSPAWSST